MRLGAVPSAAAGLLVLLLVTAATGALAEKCGRNAKGKRCFNPKHCCSSYGFCGTGPRFCAAGKCASGACVGKLPTFKPKPVPVPAGCKGTCGITVPEGRAARIACRKGLAVTAIPLAVYGALSKRCAAPTSVSVVQRLCLRKGSCVVPALNNIFAADPCRGVKKSLWFRYTCSVLPPPKPAPKPKPKPAPKPSNIFNSVQWGGNGERWTPTNRLADFSFAGYAGNQQRIPFYPAKFNVKQYGAKGDGLTDDTKAIQAALRAATAAVELMNTVDCSTRTKRRRCPRPDAGFGNGGTAGVAVFLPAGTYRVTESLEIISSNVVLRGAGQALTSLWLPRGLQAAYGKSKTWGTGGAFVLIDGNNAGSNQEKYRMARVTVDGRKGDNRLMVDTTQGFRVGQWVRLFALSRSPARRRLLNSALPADANSTTSAAARVVPQAKQGTRASNGTLPLTPTLQKLMVEAERYSASEREGVWAAAQPGTLDAFLYGENIVDSGTNSFAGTDHIRFPSRVTAVGRGWIQLERPLPYDIRTRWQVYVYRFYATTQHSGIEDMTLHFKFDVYPAHLQTYGYNAISISSAANCWVQRVSIIDADNGVQVTQSDFVTVDIVKLSVTRPRSTRETAPNDGHHALWVGRSGDVAFVNFDIRTQYMHDLSVDGFSERCVFARGRGSNLNVDCHRAGPHNHLFSNIDFGWGTRPWRSGGDGSRGAHSGANNTFWNLQASRPVVRFVALPSCDFGPLLNFVGTYWPPDGTSGRGPSRRLAAQTGSSSSSGAAVSSLSGSNATTADGLVRLAAGPAVYNRWRNWCPGTGWRIEIVQPGQQLQPADLFVAMVLTRRQRLGIP